MDTESGVGPVEEAAAGCTMLLLSAGSSTLVSSEATAFASASVKGNSPSATMADEGILRLVLKKEGQVVNRLALIGIRVIVNSR